MASLRSSPLASRSSFATTLRVSNEAEMDSALNQIRMGLKPGQKPVVIGLAADSGCGKSTFMRRVTACFGGESKLLPIGRETNTLVSEDTTVICLDDFHLNDRAGRKVSGLTALDPRENNFDLMYQVVKDLKDGKTVCCRPPPPSPSSRPCCSETPAVTRGGPAPPVACAEAPAAARR
jgi:phosphoribulokinase